VKRVLSIATLYPNAHQPRFGTFVARIDPADTAMATAAHTFVSAARALGVEKSEAMRYVDAAFGW